MSPDFDKEQAFAQIKAFPTLETSAVASILNLVEVDSNSDFEDQELQTIMAKAAITALYSQSQVRVRQLVIAAFQPSKKVLETLNNARTITLFLQNRGLDIAALKSFAAFDEVRLLSNSVTHTSYIKKRDALCEIYGWHVGNLPGHKIIKNFPRYELATTEFCEELKSTLIEALARLK